MSGNPRGGRPRKTAEVREAEALAKEKSPRAIARLAEIMESTDEKAAVSACNALLDRAMGKPAQAITGPDGEALQLAASAEQVREQLLDLLRPLRPRVVDSTAEQAGLPAKASEK